MRNGKPSPVTVQVTSGIAFREAQLDQAINGLLARHWHPGSVPRAFMVLVYDAAYLSNPLFRAETPCDHGVVLPVKQGAFGLRYSEELTTIDRINPAQDVSPKCNAVRVWLLHSPS